MKKIIYILVTAVLFSLNCGNAAAQVDSTALSVLDEKLEEYFKAIERESVEVKMEECDFMIETCTDSIVRQSVAVRLYDHFVGSNVMGDEAVVVHLTDEWFATGKVKFPVEYDLINAKIYADFLRHTLIGMKAPEYHLDDIFGGYDDMPAKGRVSLLYFYDITCYRCHMELMQLRELLAKEDHQLDIFFVYIGDNPDGWVYYVEDEMKFDSENVKLHHLWDPDYATDMREIYGIMQTPAIFLVDPEGTIIGRGLNTEALKQLLGYSDMLQELYDRCRVGSKLPDITLPATLRKGTKSKEIVSDMRKFKGRPGYVMFYTEGCANCRQELSNLETLMEKKGTRALLLNVDEILADNQELASTIFDNFDLTVLPYIMEVDKKGVIRKRGNSFNTLGEEDDDR